MANIIFFTDQVEPATFGEPIADKEEEVQWKFQGVGEGTIFFLHIRQHQGIEVADAVQ